MHIKPIVTYGLGAIAIVGVSAAIFFTLQNQRQAEQIEMLLQERNFFLKSNASSTAELGIASSTIDSLSSELTRLKDELTILADDYRNEKNRNEEFEDQIRGLAGTVGDLDKLSKTDEELLQKYSRVYFLNENYVPERLSKINSKYILSGRAEQSFHARAVDYLEEMLDDAEADGHDLKVISAYRSFSTQAQLKGQYTQVYGSGANAFSADQGYSEHQLGTTLDLTVAEVGGPYASFAQTEAYQWLVENAHEYGFVLSYPESNSFFVYEPWHWRFVGTDLARDLHRADATFYDWEQRKIDEYLIKIFD
jgi:D-alanyl-D-alanine carboxypeptidase